MDIAIKTAAAPGASGAAESELSPSERSYLGRLTRQTRLLTRVAPEIEARLQALNMVAQKDGLLMLTRKGCSMVASVGRGAD